MASATIAPCASPPRSIAQVSARARGAPGVARRPSTCATAAASECCRPRAVKVHRVLGRGHQGRVAAAWRSDARTTCDSRARVPPCARPPLCAHAQDSHGFHYMTEVEDLKLFLTKKLGKPRHMKVCGHGARCCCDGRRRAPTASPGRSECVHTHPVALPPAPLCACATPTPLAGRVPRPRPQGYRAVRGCQVPARFAR